MQYYKLINGELVKTDLEDYTKWNQENHMQYSTEYNKNFNNCSFTVQTFFSGAIQDNADIKPFFITYFGVIWKPQFGSSMSVYKPFNEAFRFKSLKEMKQKRKEIIDNIKAIALKEG